MINARDGGQLKSVHYLPGLMDHLPAYTLLGACWLLLFGICTTYWLLLTHHDIIHYRQCPFFLMRCPTCARVLLSWAGSPSSKCTVTYLSGQLDASGKIGSTTFGVRCGLVGWRGGCWAAVKVPWTDSGHTSSQHSSRQSVCSDSSTSIKHKQQQPCCKGVRGGRIYQTDSSTGL